MQDKSLRDYHAAHRKLGEATVEIERLRHSLERIATMRGGSWRSLSDAVLEAERTLKLGAEPGDTGTNPDQGFAEGFAAAVATLVRFYDQPTMAANIIASNGLGPDLFKDVAAYDAVVIRKLFKEYPVLNPKLKRRAILRRVAASQ